MVETKRLSHRVRKGREIFECSDQNLEKNIDTPYEQSRGETAELNTTNRVPLLVLIG